MHKGLIAGITAAVLAAGVVVADRLEHETRRFESQGAQRLEVGLEFGVGQLRIVPQDMEDVATLDVSYDTRRIEYDIEYYVKQRTGHLLVESSTRRKHNIDTEDNELDLILSTRYPTVLELDIGACDAEIDLGGIRLEEVNINVGAASGDFDFSMPNPHRLKEMSIDAGASSLDVRNIGNANFEVFSFDGGAGSFDLDFRGTYTGESRIDIDIGLSSADIILPEGIPVRVESDDNGWFSSVDFHGNDLEEIDDGIFESPDFDGARVRIILTIDVGMGSVDVRWQ